MAIDRMKDINAFVHVAEAKSFTTAAEQIGLSRSAVGKSISRLEDRLGVRLLQRTTRSRPNLCLTLVIAMSIP